MEDMTTTINLNNSETAKELIYLLSERIKDEMKNLDTNPNKNLDNNTNKKENKIINETINNTIKINNINIDSNYSNNIFANETKIENKKLENNNTINNDSLYYNLGYSMTKKYNINDHMILYYLLYNFTDIDKEDIQTQESIKNNFKAFIEENKHNKRIPLYDFWKTICKTCDISFNSRKNIVKKSSINQRLDKLVELLIYTINKDEEIIKYG